MGRSWGHAIAACTLVVAGCDWTGYGFGAAHAGSNPTERTIGVGNVADLALEWSQPTGHNASYMSPPAMSGGIIVVSSYVLRPDGVNYDGRLRAFAVGDGAPLWSRDLEMTPLRAPTIAGDLVFVGTGFWQDGSHSAVQAYELRTGKLRWEVPTPEPVFPPVTVSDGRVYAVSTSGQAGVTNDLYALDGATGAELWHRRLQVVFGSTPTVGHGLLVTGVVNSGVQAFDAATGTPRWTAEQPSVATVAYAYDRFYAAGVDRLAAIDPETGATLWTSRWESGLAAYGAPVLSGGTLFLQLQNLRFGPFLLAAYDARTGARKWSVALPTGQLTAANGVAYLTTGTTMYAVDGRDGAELARWNVNYPSGAVIANGHVYLHESAYPEETFLLAYGVPGS